MGSKAFSRSRSKKKIKEAYANAVKRTGKCVGFRPDDAAKILRCRGPDGVNLANKYSSNHNEVDFLKLSLALF